VTDPPTDLPDISQPLPDRGHEAIRQAVVAAIADIGTRAETFYAAVAALNTRADAAEIRANTAQADIDTLQEQMADALARVEALESPLPPEV
jgi:chromosome segregation ATPase